MTVTAKDLQDIAAEARPIIARMMDDAEVLAGLGKVCRDKGIDWAQLKALVKAQIRDDRDETGEGGHVEKIIDRADAASAYADMLANMNKKNFSCAASDDIKCGVPASIDGPRVFPDDDLTIPVFLRRMPA